METWQKVMEFCDQSSNFVRKFTKFVAYFATSRIKASVHFPKDFTQVFTQDRKVMLKVFHGAKIGRKSMNVVISQRNIPILSLNLTKFVLFSRQSGI